MVTARDARFMDRALFLAERGRGRTSPNPVVGAVVVTADGIVVGQGAHLDLGGPHAEVAALAAAGSRARGATLYSTLEPCTHRGRTEPCAEQIVAAGVARVVIAAHDPNPKVTGGGAAFLRARGIAVDEPVCAAEARRQNAPFFRWAVDGRPFVTLKAATSADGFVGQAGAPVQITGPAAQRYFHRQRAAIDAIAAGSGTVLSDNPELTPRGAFRARPLVRVIFDWRLRIPASARVLASVDRGPVIMVVSEAVVEARRGDIERLVDRGVTVESSATRELLPVLRRLAERGITWLLVEGGPALHRAFVQARLVDQVQWVIAPRLLGTGIRHGLHDIEIGPSSGMPRITPLGDDVLMEGDVHWTDRSDGAARAE